MRLQRAPALLVTAAIVLCFAAYRGPARANAPAANVASPVPLGSTLLTVSLCSPQRHGDSGGRFFGYTPGTSNLNFRDAYGYSYYQPPALPSNPQLAINYTNISGKTMSAIEFGLLANGILVGEVRDTGTFSSGAHIKHKLGLNLKLFPIPAGPERCVPLRITFADGTKWRSPHLPPKGQALYYNAKP